MVLDTARKGPLSGTLILDLTSVMMGPIATSLMADLGATVFKVESPEGDTLRHMGSGRSFAMSPNFISKNRGKYSIVLDLKKPEGRDVLLRLAEKADVFIHSMRPNAIKRLGLTYQDLSECNPRIITCNLQGFGSGGRYRDKPAYDDVIQAASGLVALMGEATGTPRYVAMPVADQVTGITAVYAVIAALFGRERTGQGQDIEVPMFETMASFVLASHWQGYTYEPPTGRPIYTRHVSPAKRPYKTSTGYLSVLVYNNKQWKAFLSLVGREDLINHELFATMGARMSNVEVVFGFVEEELQKRSAEEWIPILEAAEIPVMPILSTEDLFADPHLADVGFFKTAEHHTEGTVRYAEIPTRFSKTPGKVDHLAPNLGEDSVEILRLLDYSEEEIASMIEHGTSHDGRRVDRP